MFFTQPTLTAHIRLDSIARVVVGSTNPVKVAAVRAVLERAGSTAVAEGMSVASGVDDQPFGDADTIRGATQRARAALDASGADMAIGIEGGVVEEQGFMRTCAWAAVVTRDGRVGVGGSLAMMLPDRVATLVRAGVELGHAMDRVTGEHNTKQNAGAVGILTAGLVDRQRAYEALVTYALAPFLSSDHFIPSR
jgi:inosine/xanthosine triphosphatase